MRTPSIVSSVSIVKPLTEAEFWRSSCSSSGDIDAWDRFLFLEINMIVLVRVLGTEYHFPIIIITLRVIYLFSSHSSHSCEYSYPGYPYYESQQLAVAVL